MVIFPFCIKLSVSKLVQLKENHFRHKCRFLNLKKPNTLHCDVYDKIWGICLILEKKTRRSSLKAIAPLIIPSSGCYLAPKKYLLLLLFFFFFF